MKPRSLIEQVADALKENPDAQFRVGFVDPDGRFWDRTHETIHYTDGKGNILFTKRSGDGLILFEENEE